MITIDQIKQAIDETGLGHTVIEKKLLIGKGVLAKVLKKQKILTEEQYQKIVRLKGSGKIKAPEQPINNVNSTKEDLQMIKKVYDTSEKFGGVEKVTYIPNTPESFDGKDAPILDDVVKVNLPDTGESLKVPTMPPLNEPPFFDPREANRPLFTEKEMMGNFSESEDTRLKVDLADQLLAVCAKLSITPEIAFERLETLTKYGKLEYLSQYPLTPEESFKTEEILTQDLPKPSKRLVDFIDKNEA